MNLDTQVAVVGGGVAGAVACCALAHAGLHATWVVQPQPSNHVWVGESLAASALPLLRRLGLDHLLLNPAHRTANTRFSSWGRAALIENHAMTSVQGSGYVLDRARFEEELVQHAASCVETVNASMLNARRVAGGYQLELSRQGPVHAPFVVDATGRACSFARSYTTLQRLDQLIGAVGYAARRHSQVQVTPATLVEAVQNGWWYASLLADERMVLVHFSDPDLLPPGCSHHDDAWRAAIDSTTYVRRWLDETGFETEAAASLHTAGTTWLGQPACGYSDAAGWMAIGDAALAMDPLSSHGLATALWGGLQAGAVAGAWFRGSTAALNNYAHELLVARERYVQQRQAMYCIERRYAHAPFWQRRHRSG